MDRIRMSEYGVVYLVHETWYRKVEVINVADVSNGMGSITWYPLTKKERKKLTKNDYDDIAAMALYYHTKYGGKQ